MKKTNKRMGLCLTLLICNLVFIWGNSLLPGSVSGAFSDWVRDWLAKLLPAIGGASGGGHGLVRKLAHFTEFACLGVWLCWLCAMLKKRPWMALLGGFLAACADETIQCFVPQRGPGFRDVLIDTAGAALGVLLLWAGVRIFQRIHQQTQNLEEINT